MRGLILFELRKALNIFIVLIAAVLCAAWFFVCKLCYIGNYEEINGEIYKDYINTLSEAAPDWEEYIEGEKSAIYETLSMKQTMQDLYFSGEISDSEYLDYLDRYDYYDKRVKTFNVISEKFTRFRENPALRFIYDLELEGHLTAMTADFPLAVMLMIFAANVFIPDISIKPFILTSKNGRRKTLISKLSAFLIIMAVLIFAFNFAELAALFSKELGDLSVPAASMDRFSELNTDISCFSLIVQTFAFRILLEISMGTVFFAVASKSRKYITFFIISMIFLFPYAFLQ